MLPSRSCHCKTVLSVYSIVKRLGAVWFWVKHLNTNQARCKTIAPIKYIQHL